MKKNNIKVMLTRIWAPGNVGSILRAMKNFDFTNVVSIDQMNIDQDETLTMCAGAKDHISYLRHSNNFDKECDECNVIYAFTARRRKFYKVITPEKFFVPSNFLLSRIALALTDGSIDIFSCLVFSNAKYFSFSD